jgi:hypothetical protein
MIEQENHLKDTTSRACALVWGQCSDALGEKNKAHKDYHTAQQYSSTMNYLSTLLK